MNQNQEFNQRKKTVKKMPSASLAWVFLALATVIGALSGILGGSLVMSCIAATLAALALLCIPGTTISKIIVTGIVAMFISTGLSVGITFALYSKFFFSSLASLIYIPVAFAITLCVLNLKSRSFTVTLTAIVLVILFVMSVLAIVYDNYGSIGPSVWESMEESLTGTIEEILKTPSTYSDNGNIVPLYSEKEAAERADSLILSVKLIIPSILFIITLLCAYVMTGIYRRVLCCYTFGRKRLADWLIDISTTTATVFLISMIAYWVISIISIWYYTSVIEAIYAALMNIMLISAPGCFVIGGRSTLSLLRHKSPQALITVVILLMLGCCNPIYMCLYLGVVGASQVLIRNRLQNRNFPPNAGSENHGPDDKI